MQPIDKGMAGPGLLAYVVTSKYADYLPLYRLEDIFEQQGLRSPGDAKRLVRRRGRSGRTAVRPDGPTRSPRT